MTLPKKAIQWKPGDTPIPLSDTWAGRAAVILFICAWLFWGAWVFIKVGVIRAVVEPGPFGPMVFLIFAFWLIGLVLTCAWIVWLFFGATMISVTAEELIVRHCIAGEPIFTAVSMQLSAIADVSVEEIDVDFRGRTWHFWVLLVFSDDGAKHQVAKFNNGPDANEYMGKLVGTES